MSALLEMSLGRAFFLGLVLGFVPTLFLSRWAGRRIARRMLLSATRRVADAIDVCSDMVVESDEPRRREILFTAMERAFDARNRRDERIP